MVTVEFPFTKNDVEYARNFGKANSLCSRTKYGALITDRYGNSIAGANERVGKSCTKSYCIRDRLKIEAGDHSQVEKGAEIHAEQAVLLKWRFSYRNESAPYHMLIAAVNHIGNLNGMQNKPCYVCCRMIKYAGFTNVWLPFDDEPQAVSISGVIEEYERIHQNI